MNRQQPRTKADESATTTHCRPAGLTGMKLQRDVVLADAHALGLRALGGHLLDEFHLVALLDLVESGVHQIVEAEIQLVAVGAPDEA